MADMRNSQPGPPDNCYTYASSLLNVDSDCKMFLDETTLAKVLAAHFTEVPRTVPQRLLAGDLVVRKGHCGVATGNGDVVSQYGSSADIVPTVNRAWVLDQIGQVRPLTSQEKDELQKLKKNVEDWQTNHQNHSAAYDVPLSVLEQNRTDQFRIYRRIRHVVGKCQCGQTHPDHVPMSFRPGPGECCWCGEIHWYHGH